MFNRNLMMMLVIVIVMVVIVVVVVIVMGVMAVVMVGVALSRAAVQVMRFLRQAHLLLVAGHWQAIFAQVAGHRCAAIEQFTHPLFGHIDNQLVCAQK